MFFWFSKLPSVTSDEKIESKQQSQYALRYYICSVPAYFSCNPANKAQATGIHKQYFVYASLAIILFTLVGTIYAAGKG
jgi:FHS family L-fucose permease-like MFS transporter